MTREPEHHLSDAILMAYAAGSLSEAFSLVTATHVSLCDDCRARLAAFEEVGGALLEAAGDADLDADALSDCITRIERPEAVSKASPRGGHVFPAPLADYVGGDLDAVKWKTVGGGVKQAVLKTGDDAATVRLLSIPAGMAVPDHSHSGTELTLVLQGAFSDEGGRFARGDVEMADDDVEHQPVAEEGLDCICLAATEAPLKFRGLLPRLAQPFIGI